MSYKYLKFSLKELKTLKENYEKIINYDFEIKDYEDDCSFDIQLLIEEHRIIQNLYFERERNVKYLKDKIKDLIRFDIKFEMKGIKRVLDNIDFEFKNKISELKYEIFKSKISELRYETLPDIE